MGVTGPVRRFPALVHRSVSILHFTHSPFFLKGDPMRVLYINNDGGGFADHIEVADGTTVSKLFEHKLPDRSSGDYLIRVNRQPAAPDQALAENDRVSFTPTKIEGA
jgi:hypothetical protein